MTFNSLWKYPAYDEKRLSSTFDDDLTIISPSNFLLIVSNIFSELSSGPSAYTIIGMGGVAAAVMGAPISTTLIVFELTDDYPLTIAVMVAVVLSSLLTNQFAKGSFFNWQLEQAGYDLKGGFETALLRSITVNEVMAKESETLSVATGLQEVRERLQNSKTGELFVVKEDGEFLNSEMVFKS